MNDYNENKEKKGGFLSSLSGLFRGGSSAMGGASSGLGSAGSAGGLGGLFATKAGVVGLVLGGATIAAGVGVVYNFIGPSSSGVYSPELFQNTYYEEEANRAGLERSKARDSSAASSSTLDMFKEQARKDGLGGLAGETGDAESANAAAEDPTAADGAASAASADSNYAGAPGASGGGGPKLQSHSGFGSKGGGGGSGTAIPRMQGGSGLAGGIGAQFQPVYRAPAQANTGKSSGMLASNGARISRSPKHAINNFNKKGAFGQAKFASGMSKKAASYSGATSASMATEAMQGESSGSGDVAGADTGAGLGGAGVSNGQSLKASDPSLSSNESSVPEPSKPEDVDPWQKFEDMAMYSLLAGGVLLLITNVLVNKANAALATTPVGLALYATLRMWAMITGYAAIAAGLVAIYAGMMMFSQYDQKMMGGVYMAAGAMLIWKAYEAMSGLGEAEGSSTNKGTMDSPKNGDTAKIGNQSYECKADGKWTKVPSAEVKVGN